MVSYLNSYMQDLQKIHWQICKILVYHQEMYIIHLPVQETQVWFLGQEDPPEKQPTPVFLPGKSHGVAIPFSRGSSQPRDWTLASGIEPRPLALQADSIPAEPPGKRGVCVCVCVCVFIYMIQCKLCYRTMFIVRILSHYGMN